MAALSLTHVLSTTASLGVNASYSDIETLGTTTDDSSAGSLSLSLSYALGQDVDLVAGYRFRDSRDNDSSAQANSVFFTLSRDFIWLH